MGFARVFSLVTLTACGASGPPPNTGGTSELAGTRGRGLTIRLSDYVSSNVALADPSGQTLSGSLVSSDSAEPGLSAPLSGDVVLASTPETGDEIALLDRYPAAVVTMVSATTGQVSAQIDVTSGFRSNPHDLARVNGAFGPELWIARFGHNPTPGKQSCDRGGDLLVVDAASHALAGCVELTAAIADSPGFLAFPNKVAPLGDRLVVLLQAYRDDSYKLEAPSRLALIDPSQRAIVAFHVLTGLYGCMAMAIEPPFDAMGAPRDERRIVVGCSGRFMNGPNVPPTLAESGVAVLSAGGDELQPLARYPAQSLAGAKPVGLDLDLDESGRALLPIVGQVEGSGMAATPDSLVELDLASGQSRVVLSTMTQAFVLGGVRCMSRIFATDPSGGLGAPASADCFVADAEAGVLHRLVAGPAGYADAQALRVENAIGLPPRELGRF